MGLQFIKLFKTISLQEETGSNDTKVIYSNKTKNSLKQVICFSDKNHNKRSRYKSCLKVFDILSFSVNKLYRHLPRSNFPAFIISCYLVLFGCQKKNYVLCLYLLF